MRVFLLVVLSIICSSALAEGFQFTDLRSGDSFIVSIGRDSQALISLENGDRNYVARYVSHDGRQHLALFRLSEEGLHAARKGADFFTLDAIPAGSAPFAAGIADFPSEGLSVLRLEESELKSLLDLDPHRAAKACPAPSAAIAPFKPRCGDMDSVACCVTCGRVTVCADVVFTDCGYCSGP